MQNNDASTKGAQNSPGIMQNFLETIEKSSLQSQIALKIYFPILPQQNYRIT